MLRHKLCGHEWLAPPELEHRITQDINGGTGGVSPPVKCPSCGVSGRYSTYEVVETDA